MSLYHQDEHEGPLYQDESVTYPPRFRHLELPDLLAMVLVPYAKQQRRILEEFGGDEAEVKRRVERMKDWAEFCAREKRAVHRKEIASALFGPAEPPRFDPLPGHKCDTCGGSGLYFSDECQGKRDREPTEGIVVCFCGAGKARNTAIRDAGRRLQTTSRRRPPAEEF